MAEAAPIGFVLGTKPASSLEFYALPVLDELNKYAPREGHSPIQDILLNIAESQSPEYDYLPESFRLRSTIIKPGTMIVHQPDIPAPVLINFPLPAWATRGEEVDDQDLDKAAREFAEKF
jgi:DNA helicase HerA-like ATPase